ncbi:MAG: hypothetical protein E7453_01980 [Ruminococcaceae bacterium]|nr:hypothetical protein [Oscillospiraceae bacterium]
MKTRKFAALSVMLALILCFTGCENNTPAPTQPPSLPCQHRDADDNHKCDYCGTFHIDETDLNQPTGTGECTHTSLRREIENEKDSCTEQCSYDEVYYCTACGEETKRETVYANPRGHTSNTGYCLRCGELDAGVTIDPNRAYTRYENYIFFGEYPQALKNENVTVTSTQDARGYYLGSDGNYYAKVTASLNGNYTFHSGDAIENGQIYYFKVAPLRWRILTESNGKALLVCDSIITSKVFQSKSYQRGDYYYLNADNSTLSNDYLSSEIRLWLNQQLYNTVFTSLQQQLIQAVDGDNLLLLSGDEVCNSAYGFASSHTTYDAARRPDVSDFCRALGQKESWWLRTAFGTHGEKSLYVYEGKIGERKVTYEAGVVPALWIKL